MADVLTALQRHLGPFPALCRQGIDEVAVARTTGATNLDQGFVLGLAQQLADHAEDQPHALGQLGPGLDTAHMQVLERQPQQVRPVEAGILDRPRALRRGNLSRSGKGAVHKIPPNICAPHPAAQKTNQGSLIREI